MERIKKRNLIITLVLSVCMLFAVVVCSGSKSVTAMADTSVSTSTSQSDSTSAKLVNSKIMLYDGSVDSTALTSVTKDNVEMTVKGFSTTTNSLSSVVVNEKTYLKSTPTGGKSSSSRYIRIVVDDEYESFVVNVVATSNSSTAVKIGVGIASTYTNDDTEIMTTGTDNTVYTSGTSVSLASGTYYLTFDGSTRIAELSITATKEDKSVIGTLVQPTNATKYIKIALGSVSVLTLILVLVLCIKLTVDKNKIVRR